MLRDICDRQTSVLTLYSMVYMGSHGGMFLTFCWSTLIVKPVVKEFKTAAEDHTGPFSEIHRSIDEG